MEPRRLIWRLEALFAEQIYHIQEKILHTYRPKLSFSCYNTEYCGVKAALAVFAVYEWSWKIKNITMVYFNDKVLSD